MNPPVIPLNKPVSAFPRRFGQHILISKLAEGGMAELFLAKQLGAEGFERTVVIKCMLEHFSRSPEFREMFLDEARLAARLFHPNIVQISDLGVAEDRHFICMEYLPGEDLETLIQVLRQRGELIPLSVAMKILVSACEGLGFAHGFEEGGRKLNLVHRDVSPSNIFVTFQGVVKVLDFGIAKASSRVTSTQPGTLKGKWGYMSPEQARGEPLDARSDLFSLGVTFYELLTGRRMVERDNEVGVLMALMQQDTPPPSTLRPDIPPALDAIILKAIARDREQRYQSALEFQSDLESVLATAPITRATQLAHYVQSVFGPEWVSKKSNIPTLAELGVPVSAPAPALVHEETSGFEKTFVRPGAPESDGGAQTAIRSTGPSLAQLQSLAQPPSLGELQAAPAAPSRSSRLGGVLIGALTTVLLLAGAGAAAFYFAPDEVAELLGRAPPAIVKPLKELAQPLPAEGVTPEAELANAPEEPATDAGKVQPETAQAGGSEEASTVAAAAVVEEQEKAPARPRPARAPKAIHLTQKEVTAVLQRRAAQLLSCGEKYKPELPADRRVEIVFTVSRAGRVAEAKTSLDKASPNLGRCLRGEIQSLAFPRNSNIPEFQIALPIQFTGG